MIRGLLPMRLYVRVLTVSSVALALALSVSALVSTALGGAAPADELLPDLRPVPPFNVVVQQQEERFVLGFAANSENIGDGYLKVRGNRPDAQTEQMRADQLVQLLDGSERVYEGAGIMSFVVEPDHRHWHWIGFMRYDLRSASTMRSAGRDVKSGFCIADRQQAAGYSTPRFFADPSWCEFENPDALQHVAGISIGWGDPYAAILEGQQIDVTGLPSGRYYLTHQVNPERLLRESNYLNNRSAAVVHLSWPRGKRAAPRVKLLAACDVIGTARRDVLRDTDESREGVCGLDGHDTIHVRSGFDDKVFGGRGNDRLFGPLAQAVLDGELGKDTVDYRTARQPIRIDLRAGVARSAPGTDRLRSIESARGGRSRDTLIGNRRANVLAGGPGDDTLDGGKGRDVLRGQGGDDEITSRDGARDAVDCGAGHDTVIADALDRVAANCEVVRLG